jgi:hypothetical protein
LPSITAADPWEKKMAEGVAFLQQMKSEAAMVKPKFTEEDDALLN